MESMIELCDIIAKNPEHFSDKIAWICGRCPQPESLLGGSPRVSRSQLNAVLAVARFLSKCPHSTDNRPKSVILEFIQAIPASFRRSFWPQSYNSDSIASFFVDFLKYVSESADSSPDFASEIAGLVGKVVTAAVNNHDTNSNDSAISRAFSVALSQNFPPVLPSDADKLINYLFDQLAMSVPASPSELITGNSETTSSQSSPLSVNHFQGNEVSSPANDSSSGSLMANGGGVYWKSGADQLGNANLINDRGGAMFRQQIASFEEESVESLEKQEIAFKLIGHILHKVSIDQKLLEQVRLIAKKQLQSMSAFLKIRKRDWTEQGPFLKSRINAKLSVYQAAARMQIRSLVSLDADAKTSKKLVLETLALLIDAAEACLLSVWRKLRVCEELFSSLLSGIAHVAVPRGGQPLRVLLIRLKPLVLAACMQADTWGSSQGAMFESVLKTCCEIIESGWTKDRAPIDTFIMGLATSIRERNDYEDQVDKEKQAAPAVQLNVIRLLADLNVAISKPEVVDMMLPLFIESLEEGDAITASLLRLRLLDAVSRMASLGFEKSYREAVVLMTRSYLSKLSSVGSAESKTLAPEATTERVEVYIICEIEVTI